jgi:hypothetical protein
MFFQLLVLGCGSNSTQPLLGKYLKDLEDSHNGILPTARNYSTIAQLYHTNCCCHLRWLPNHIWHCPTSART